MHRLAAIPGGWNPGQEGVIFIEQTPAEVVWITAADTEIQTLAAAVTQLPPDFPTLRVVNMLQLQQQLTIDTYAETVLESAQVIVVRLLGGRGYWAYGLEVVKQLAERKGIALFVLPGDDRPDPDLISHSTVALTLVDALGCYLREAGVSNLYNALLYLGVTCLGRADRVVPPQVMPKIGVYPWPAPIPLTGTPQAAILFYRAHYQSGNTAIIDVLCQALLDRGLTPLPIFVTTLQEPELQAALVQLLPNSVQIILNTTSFALAKLATDGPNVELWQTLDVPVLQVICSSGSIEQWQAQWQGLLPRDMAMHVALPEVDGRLISRAISFKAVQTRHPLLETEVIHYQPLADRVDFVADLARNWVRLRQTPVKERQVALILANYPNRDGRLANGVGLDTPASCVAILQALQTAGYDLGELPLPTTSQDLITLLTQGVTNDPEGWSLRHLPQSLPLADYLTYWATLPELVRTQLWQRWGDPAPEPHPQLKEPGFAIPGVQLGKVFVGIQPARGYDLDPSLNYHAPDLEPPHAYLGFYFWLRQHFGAQAVVHVGKHGNLEWLPGKSIALSQTCYPEIALGPMPHLYPFIVNDPGEGSQAKRRSQAVIIDHLTPPLTRAELYGPLEQLEALVDEYYQAESLDPKRLPILQQQISRLLQQEQLGAELEAGQTRKPDWGELLRQTDGYLCELKEAQIRDGLHIFGQCPQGRQLQDLLVALARQPGPGRTGLTRALALDWGLGFDPLTTEPTSPLNAAEQATLTQFSPCSCRHHGDAIEVLEHQAALLVDALLTRQPLPQMGAATAATLTWLEHHLLPNLQATTQEITHLLKGLAGGYIPSGPSGAPTRGRPEVLPTGRNFYSVDLRGLPTESAWQVGRKAAEAVIERYSQEQGDYPRSLGLSLWGTATMRTGGDDLAEALALLGVQPVWEGVARRVVDFEILPLSYLGRPRVDVTLRISGFFRDAFSNLIDLFDRAVQAVACLDEPADQNPLAAQVRQDTAQAQAQGLSPEAALHQAQLRIFGSKPGAYGAGLQDLMESQQWQSDADLARAYINWSSYAYTGQAQGQAAPAAFQQRLAQMQIVLHNQDNREHDLLDSDDYYQFQGGLTAAVRHIQGQQPQTYFGDHSRPDNPQVKRLEAEIAKVYRSRVINPKWIAGAMRHGYKGAFELAATVDYLFAYDATAHCVADYMYTGIAQAYLLEPQVQQFIQTHNPWSLRDMAERLLEANQRGLWQDAPPEVLNQLRNLVLEAEGLIESRSL
jgi:cobaltochelatase CobN